MRPLQVPLAAALLAAVLAVPRPSGLAAQSPLVLDVRAGATLPTGSFVREGLEAELSPGAGFGLHFTLQRHPWRAFYAGFSQHRFGCDGAGCPGGGELVSTGWNLGTRLSVATGGASPWLRLGVVFDRVEADFLEGGDEVGRVSDLGVGGEVGIGVVMGTARRLSLSPGVRYVLVDGRFERRGLVRMRYLVADLGAVIAF